MTTGGLGDNQASNETFGVIDATNGMPSNGYGGSMDSQEALNRGANAAAGGNPNAPINYSNDALDKYNRAAPWTGAGGQGYYDPRTGQTYNFSNAPPGSVRLDRPGIDKRLQGNLEDPYAGYYGGAPGVAQGEEARYAGLANSARNTPGAQINNGQYYADRGLEMGARGNQDYALDQYKNLISGTGPSVAQQQLNYGLARSMAQGQSLMSSARGGGANLVAAQQSGANAVANASGQANSQAALLRATEVRDALAGYSSLSSQQRAADLQRQGLSADQAYKQAQLEEQQHAINATTGLGYEQMRQNVFTNDQQGHEYNESENQNAYMGGAGLGEQQNARQQQQTNQYISGGAGLAAGLLTYGAGASAGKQAADDIQNSSSDIRGKRDIGDGAPAVRAQMAAMNPQTYAYKNPDMPGAGPGPRVGVMAQDMERGPYGHQLVHDTPHGKQIDGPGGLSLALAAGTDHEKRLRDLEARAQGMPMGGAPGDAAAHARAQAYNQYVAARGASQPQPMGGLAAAHYATRQQNAAPFNRFVPEGNIRLPPQQPSGLAAAADLEAQGYR